MLFTLDTTEEFDQWLDEQAPKFQAQVYKRLSNIQKHGHFGEVNRRLTIDGQVVPGLYEIKFNNGCRIYYAHTAINEIILLLGGNKNGQSKDIKKAAGYL